MDERRITLRNLLFSGKKLIFAVAAVVAFSAVAVAADETKPAPETCRAERFVTGELILKLQPGVSLEEFASARKLGVKKKSASGMHLVFVAVAGLDSVAAALRTYDTCVALNSDPAVVYAELNGKVSLLPPKPSEKSAAAVEAPSSCSAREFVPGEILLKLNDGNARLAQFAKGHKLKIKKISSAGFALVAVRLTGMNSDEALDATREACAALNRDPEVEYAELNAIVKTMKK